MVTLVDIPPKPPAGHLTCYMSHYDPYRAIQTRKVKGKALAAGKIINPPPADGTNGNFEKAKIGNWIQIRPIIGQAP